MGHCDRNGQASNTMPTLRRTLSSHLLEPMATEQRSLIEETRPRLSIEENRRLIDLENKARILLGDMGPRLARERVWPLDLRWQETHPAQRPVLAQVRLLLTSWTDRVRAGRGLVLLGTVGTGKDHLAACCLWESVRLGFTARWLYAQTHFARLRDGMDGGQQEDTLVQPYIEADVLTISDPIPPLGDLTAWNTNQLLRLVDERYRRMRPTILTVNAADEKDVAARLSTPLFDRVREGAEIFVCRWPSFRRQQDSPTSIAKS